MTSHERGLAALRSMVAASFGRDRWQRSVRLANWMMCGRRASCARFSTYGAVSAVVVPSRQPNRPTPPRRSPRPTQAERRRSLIVEGAGLPVPTASPIRCARQPTFTLGRIIRLRRGTEQATAIHPLRGPLLDACENCPHARGSASRLSRSRDRPRAAFGPYQVTSDRPRWGCARTRGAPPIIVPWPAKASAPARRVGRL